MHTSCSQNYRQLKLICSYAASPVSSSASSPRAVISGSPMNPFRLLDSPADARLMSAAGQPHIREKHADDRHLIRWVQLIDASIGDQARAGPAMWSPWPGS